MRLIWEIGVLTFLLQKQSYKLYISFSLCVEGIFAVDMKGQLKSKTQFYRISSDLDKTNKSKNDKSEDTIIVRNHIVADLCHSDPLNSLGRRYKIKSKIKTK